MTVSIHAPRVGCDLATVLVYSVFKMFQFTHPVWGATPICSVFMSITAWFQFTHPVWGATQSYQYHQDEIEFQFTPPVWGATTATLQQIV